MRGNGGWIGLAVLVAIGFGAWYGLLQPRIHKDAIQVVMAQDKRIGDWAEGEAKRGANARQIVRIAIEEMKGIDLTKCPPDFQQAYLKHIYAWSELSPLLEKYEGVGGFLTAFFEGLTGRYEGDKEAQRLRKSLNDSFLEVEVIALRYGSQRVSRPAINPQPTTAPAPFGTIDGFTAAFTNLGNSRQDLEIKNSTQHKLKEATLIINAHRDDDGGILTEKAFAFEFGPGQVVIFNVPAHYYKNVTLEGTAIDDSGKKFQIQGSWVWKTPPSPKLVEPIDDRRKAPR